MVGAAWRQLTHVLPDPLPINTIILLSTITGFHTFIPIMFASLTSFFLAPRTPLIASQLKG